MSFQTPITIAEAIRNIESNRYLLPAIQREFTWESEKIEWLFDSIMRNYPISSFLFWRVEGETKNAYKFYQFLREFRQNYKTHNEEINTTSHYDFTAVLDGQQRLTSLYIGLKGSFAYRTPKLKEENTERVYPTRELYLNVSEPLKNEEDGRIYEFKFLKPKDTEGQELKWFKVSNIFSLADDFEFSKYIDNKGYRGNEFSHRSLSVLKSAIHSRPIINYFLETEQNIDKALNIFIRINSGGEPLNFSDLIMSIAVANWEQKDARKEIHRLTDNIRDKGFKISKDFVLKTFLYLYSVDIKFKVTNFSKENAKEFEKKWNEIQDTILSTFDLVKSFGFTDSTLTSKNSLLPIIYYIYHLGIHRDFHSKIAYKDDRKLMKKWLHVVLVKRLFGGHSDTILSQIRKAFTTDIQNTKINKMNNFPVAEINLSLKKDIGITSEYIEALLLTQKDDTYAFSILALLYPNLDYKNNSFHLDHMHPADSFKSLAKIHGKKISWETYNSILNLQMLDANENMSKNKKPLKDWIDLEIKSQDRKAFLENHIIPEGSFDLDGFEDFISERKKLLALKLNQLLN